MSTTASPPQGFNADKRAEERASAGVTAGGVTYKPVRKTTEVMKDVRRCGREQERLGRRAARLERDADKLLEEADNAPGTEGAEELEGRADDLINQADALHDEAAKQTFVMLAALLADDAGNHPDPGDLEATLDIADGNALAAYLMPDASEPDPTPPTGTTTT